MKKVKKFGRGGDILTGVGAALLGKALYDRYNEKDSKSNIATITGTKDLLSDAIKSAPKKSDAPKSDDSAEAKDSGRNSELSPVEQHAAITKRSDTPRAVPVIKKKTNKNDASSSSSSTTSNSATRGFGGDTIEAGQQFARIGRRGKPTPVAGPENQDRKSKPYPAEEAAARLKKAADKRRSGQGLTPYGTYDILGGSEETRRINNSIAREIQAKKQFDENKAAGMKKGGAVKSASARADGCAIRGKTRAQCIS